MEPISVIALASEVLNKTGLASWIGKKIGGNKAAKAVVDVAKAVAGSHAVESWTPEQIEKVRQSLLDNEFRIEQLNAEDRKSARQMQMAALAQDDKFSKRFVYYLASFWSIFAASYIFGITFFDVPEGSQRFADTCLGFVLGSIISTIITFFYGSSSGSKAKTDAIMKATRTG